MTAIERSRSARGMDKLQQALTEARRLTQSGVEEIRHEGREIGNIAKSGFRDLAEEARLLAARDCILLGAELTKLGRKLQGIRGGAAKPVRKARRIH